MSAVNNEKYSKMRARGLSKKDITISFLSICWFLFGLQLLLANVAKHSVFYQISALLFISFSFIYLFTHKAVRLNKYYLITVIFIVYNLMLILFGNVVDSSHSLMMLRTISINLILFILTYSFLVHTRDTEKLLNLYIKVVALTNIIILFINSDSLFTGRLASSSGDTGRSFYLFGFEVLTSGSNGIAYISAVAFLFSTYLFFTKRNKIYLFYDLLFVITILLTGSRKGLFLLVLGLVLLMITLGKKSKKILYGMIAIFLAIFIYYLSQHIPVLYEIIGSRTEELFNLILGRNVSDPSINSRMYLIESAISFVKENPVYGYGLDAFRIIGPWGLVTDNNFLEILVSSGLIGFIIYYSFALFVLIEYLLLKNKSNYAKMFFVIFVITLFIELGSVTYFERNFGFVSAMLFYILKIEKRGRKNVEEKSA